VRVNICQRILIPGDEAVHHFNANIISELVLVIIFFTIFTIGMIVIVFIGQMILVVVNLRLALTVFDVSNASADQRSKYLSN
jgi:hypothetical protein